MAVGYLKTGVETVTETSCNKAMSEKTLDHRKRRA